MKRGLMLPLALVFCVVSSALLVVKSKHENRQRTQQLEDLRNERARLETEWAQLQLEEATLAHHGRVEQIAREQLQMSEPRDFVMVSPKGDVLATPVRAGITKVKP